VAETVGARDDQEAVVRVRQNGEDSVILKLYRVDDLAGTIDGLAPGDAGYAAAAEARAYATASGATSIQGPGFGNYTQTRLVNVDAGDLIAMQLSNGANIFWGFAAANEKVGGAPVDHLWNYGLNTWAGKTSMAAATATSMTSWSNSTSAAPSATAGWPRDLRPPGTQPQAGFLLPARAAPR
jgi:hypothetical protein